MHDIRAGTGYHVSVSVCRGEWYVVCVLFLCALCIHSLNCFLLF